MKLRNAVIIIALIIIADQVLKIWIKTSFPFGDTKLTGLEWFKLYFIENKGMAWGWEFGGEWGKMILVKLIAVLGMFLALAATTRAQVKQVEMHIDGYLCGN